MNFYQLNSLMSGENPYDLKPLNAEDMCRYERSAEVETSSVIQTMEIQNQVGLKPLDTFEVGIRPSYEFDKFGTPVMNK